MISNIISVKVTFFRIIYVLIEYIQPVCLFLFTIWFAIKLDSYKLLIFTFFTDNNSFKYRDYNKTNLNWINYKLIEFYLFYLFVVQAEKITRVAGKNGLRYHWTFFFVLRECAESLRRIWTKIRAWQWFQKNQTNR